MSTRITLGRSGARLLLVGLSIGLLSACATHAIRPAQPQPATGYFDAHSHMGGVLPWAAYVDLPTYTAQLERRGPGVSEAEKLRFYTWLDDTWYAPRRTEFGDQPFSSTMRYSLGARATLELYPPRPDMAPAVLDGALDRILTATPFTEFDSAYAFHGPAYDWLTQSFYAGSGQTTDEALCTASVLELARSRITRSEQSVSFIGGWKFDAEGYSSKLQDVLCAARKPRELQATFQRLHEAVPRVQVILMTHTNQLGENAAGVYQTFELTGRCHSAPLSARLKLSPAQMYEALLGRDGDGTDIVPPGAQTDFFDTLVGIDTAAPEMTCFSAAGMTYYAQLVAAVYRAAKARRAHGWRGKLLVRTHVGEGFTTYYAHRPPSLPWTFASVFARVPAIDGNVVTDSQAPRDNIDMLLGAVDKLRQSHPDLDDYIVIRFGHLTHATLQQAQAMARLHVEADINLDSNIATGAWSFAQMPAGVAMARRAAQVAADPRTNFELNDLSSLLIPDAGDEMAVAGVFGAHPLKYMLMAHVRVMLGSDGEGVEHASMPREYALAASLIGYWQAHDPRFRRMVGDAGRQTLFANAVWHLADMSSDSLERGSGPD